MDVDAYRAHLGLKPLPHTKHETPTTKPQTHLNQHVDRSRTDSQELRGIPAIGQGVTGAIPGTRPGDPAAALEQAGRDTLQAHLHRNRHRPGGHA